MARSLGEVLKAARLRARLSQSAVARQAGIDPSALSAIESGRRQDLRFETVARIAEALGVSLDTIARDCGFRFATHPETSLALDVARLTELLRAAQSRHAKADEATDEALRVLGALTPRRRRR